MAQWANGQVLNLPARLWQSPDWLSEHFALSHPTALKFIQLYIPQQLNEDILIISNTMTSVVVDIHLFVPVVCLFQVLVSHNNYCWKLQIIVPCWYHTHALGVEDRKMLVTILLQFSFPYNFTDLVLAEFFFKRSVVGRQVSEIKDHYACPNYVTSFSCVTIGNISIKDSNFEHNLGWARSLLVQYVLTYPQIHWDQPCSDVKEYISRMQLTLGSSSN